MYPNLRAEIARKGWTISKLAELLGMAPANLSPKLNGKYDFSLTEAREIKRLLGVDMTIDELFARAK